MTLKDKQIIVLASRNKGKIQEISQILKSVLPDIQVKGLDEFPGIGDIPETGTTFEENALIKARTVARLTGLPAIADDSGIAVPALGGDPGVYSARYAGEQATDQENNHKLLEKMKNTSGKNRRAAFVCSMVAVTPDDHILSVRGEWPGLIAESPRGTMGFGYDPIFFDPELGLHAAEMTPEQKNSRSHRGKALKHLAADWPGFAQKIQKTEK
ncbi:XTP/dITP diphosphatase [Desulfonatronovibrio hydrogenovorans]|uniref:XTP/dITP diphosphatase n=1 Tax=Desulfonatronovibrio hydrogenovorans TaxID=53245 RepID=UPI00048EF8C9|nr:XTP/dITP diphosphatase [Desulfonatronovibrio hydrogenovorans]